jgi:hypothetical protein
MMGFATLNPSYVPGMAYEPGWIDTVSQKKMALPGHFLDSKMTGDQSQRRKCRTTISSPCRCRTVMYLQPSRMPSA